MHQDQLKPIENRGSLTRWLLMPGKLWSGQAETQRSVNDAQSGPRGSNATDRRARPGTILVVEDNQDSRDILSKLLQLSGFDVIEASDGVAGYAAATAMTAKPDLIITDIHMPRMDGLEFLKRARLDARIRQIPIMAVTAYGPMAAQEAREAGADEAMGKPFDFAGLLAAINRLIGNGGHAYSR